MTGQHFLDDLVTSDGNPWTSDTTGTHSRSSLASLILI